MKRFLLISLVLTLALALTGCGGDAATDGGSTDAGGSAGSTGGSSDAIATIEDLQAALADQHGDAEWYGDITDLTVETMLGAKVLAVHVAWSSTPDDYEAANRKSAAIDTALFDLKQAVATNVVLMHSDGVLWPLSSSNEAADVPMAEAFALPPAPQTAAEVEQWLATVYGPGGLVTLGADETWYDSIQSVGMETVADDPTLIVTTSAPGLFTRDVSLIESALRTTASPLLSNYGIRTADGNGSAASSGVGGSPGDGGFYYPKP